MIFNEKTLNELSIDGRGSYGIGASAVEYSDDLYTYLRITDINDDGTLNLKDLKSVNDEKASEYLLTQTSHPLSGRSTLKTQYF